MAKEIPNIPKAKLANTIEKTTLKDKAAIKADQVMKEHKFSVDWQQPEFVKYTFGDYLRIAHDWIVNEVLKKAGYVKDTTKSIWVVLVELLTSLLQYLKR